MKINGKFSKDLSSEQHTKKLQVQINNDESPRKYKKRKSLLNKKKKRRRINKNLHAQNNARKLQDYEAFILRSEENNTANNCEMKVSIDFKRIRIRVKS